MKMKKLVTTLSLLAVVTIVVFIGCKKDTYEKIESICPIVLSTNPANGATGVPLSQVITVTFNEEMNPATITNESFIVSGSIVAGTVTYSGKTATFTPASPLIDNHTYSGKVTTAAKDLMGNRLQQDYIWTFSTGAIISPLVIKTDPINLETGVVLDKVIRATFSEPMNRLTITDSSFKLKQGTTAIAGTVTYSDSVAYFTPNVALTPNTVYTATITNKVRNNNGNAMQNDYVWSFTTLANASPTVISTDPSNLEAGVALNKIISATFSVPMQSSTLNTTTFTLQQGTNLITGTVSYIGTTAYFNPSANLLAGTIYTAIITTGAKSTLGIAMASDYVWTFTTGTLSAPTIIATDPVNLATGVALNKIISATFSEAMNPLTINSSTFTLKQGTTLISGTVSYSGVKATFTPSVNLLSGKTYTATITTGAKNLTGTSLATTYVWTFSTQAPLGPQGPDLKSVGRFGIIAGTAVSNNAGFSKINNLDVGIYPGARSSLTGFPPAVVVNGSIYASDDVAPPGVAAMLLQAKNDLVAAYLFAEGASSPAPATVSGDQGGKTLAPGIYKTTSTLLIQSGDLTLDAQGDANAVWIFQVASTFTTIGGAGGNVILSGGAQAKNVYWQVGTSATIGDYTKFKGNVLALTSITMGAYSTAVGRMLARNGAVTMTSTNIIDKP
jgi:hypothetical protein